MSHRAYSFLRLKGSSDEKRIITGIATSPQVDRDGDTIDPRGIVVRGPISLLWMHDRSLPVGSVKFGRATAEGLPFEATLPEVDGPPALKARIDEAWVSIKNKLVGGVSIGFRALKRPMLDPETGGYQFSEIEIDELSLVTVPSNTDATIQTIKSASQAQMAALGQTKGKGGAEKKAGVSAKHRNSTKETKAMSKVKISERKKTLTEDRAAKVERMNALMTKTAEEGVTLSVEDNTEFENITKEVTAIDRNLAQIDALEKAQIVGAKAVHAEDGQDGEDASDARSTDEDAGDEGDEDEGAEDPVFAKAAPSAQVRVRSHAAPRSQIIQVRDRSQQAKGLAFAQVVKCLGMAKGNLMHAFELSKLHYKSDRRIQNILKAAVAAGTTTNSTWAAPLVGEESRVFADFVEFLRPTTILGKFGANGIPSLRKVPFRTRLLGQTSGGNGYWVGEGKAKPLTKFDFASNSLDPLKVANIAVITQELMRDSSPSADVLVRDSLAAALRERLDLDFIDPDKSASAGVSPASILNGVTPIASSGNDADAIRCDIQAIMRKFIDARNPPTNGVWLMPSTVGLAASLLTNDLGQKEFPEINMNGGTLGGLPVITSEYVPTDTSGSVVALVNASDIYEADDGEIKVDMSTEASLQMLDNPTNDGTGATAPTSLVSLWQDNLVGFRAERTINWSKRRASAAQYLSGVNWGACE
jgi:HK97 family phage prohead protease